MLETTLKERGKRYGDFAGQSEIGCALLDVLIEHRHKLRAYQFYALFHIISKISRILNGDPDYQDSWVDIGGFSKLVETCNIALKTTPKRNRKLKKCK